MHYAIHETKVSAQANILLGVVRLREMLRAYDKCHDGAPRALEEEAFMRGAVRSPTGGRAQDIMTPLPWHCFPYLVEPGCEGSMSVSIN